MRLIDAENFSKAMKDYFTDMVTHHKYNADCIDCNADLQHLLDNQQTTYDIDKTVEELEENASRYTKKYITPYGNNGYKDTKAVSIHKAVEIVKHGCVSDDVCECRLLKGYNFLHKTSCGDVFEMENGFKFCPYCGKKIKIVGG